MAIYLFKLARRKYRENQAKKAVPTTDDSHLVPNLARHHQKLDSNDHTQEASEVTTLTQKRDDHVDAEEAARQKEESRKRTIRQWKLMIGLALPNFLAAVDVTIVAPAIPLISSHFSTPCTFRLHSQPDTNHPKTTSPAPSTGSSPPTP